MKKYIMRKFFAAIMLVLLFITAGCDETKNQPPSPPKPSSGQTVETNPEKENPGQPHAQRPAEVKTKLYFPTPDGDGLVALDVTIHDEDPCTAAVKLLIQGTDDKGIVKIFPEGVKILSVKVKDGIATADFSAELTKKFIGGSTGEEMLISSLVNTLTEFPDVKSVLITVEGQKIETISGHMDTSAPFTRPAGIVK